MTLSLAASSPKALYHAYKQDPEAHLTSTLLSLYELLFSTSENALDEQVIKCILLILTKACRQDCLLTRPTCIETAEEDALNTVRFWLVSFIKKLVEEKLLKNPSRLSFDAVLALMELGYGKENEEKHEDILVEFPNGLWFRIMRSFIIDDHNCYLMVKEAMSEFDDLCFYGYRNLARLAQEGESCLTGDQISRLCQVLIGSEPMKKTLDTATSVKDAFSDDDFVDSDSTHYSEDENDSEEEEQDEKEESEPEKLALHCLLPVDRLIQTKSFNSEFSAAWQSLLEHCLDRMPANCLLHVLDSMDQVIPCLTHPLKLVDFMLKAYEVHGWPALSALWTLIREHGADCPSFYDKLLSLLSRNDSCNRTSFSLNSFSQKHAKLLDLFLRSTHLPNRLIGRFVAQLLILAQFAEPPQMAFQVYIPLAYNLLKRTPVLMPLLDGSLASADCNDELVQEVQSTLLTLVNHYHTPVAKLVRQLFLEPRSLNKLVDYQVPMSSGQEAVHLYDQLIEQESKHRWSKVPPCYTVLPDSLFS